MIELSPFTQPFDEKKYIIEKAKAGTKPGRIAAELKVASSRIYYVLKLAREAGEDIPKFKHVAHKRSLRTKPLKLPQRITSLLESEAARHGKTPSEYGQQLLEKALLDGVDKNG